MISQNIINQVIEEVDIVDLVGTYLPLTPKGKNYWAVCPFHNDSNPSMSVSREKKFFKCFSCGTSGNAIAFVQKYEHISYYEAAAKLATKIGIKIEEFDTPEYRKNKQYYLTMDEAKNFYQFYLNNTAEGLKAKNYLDQRGITQEIIDKFQIGLAPSSADYLYKALLEKEVGLIEQIDLGLIRENNEGTYYDTFRNRIIFPIANNEGQIVGLSGRIYLDNDKNSKYLNSQENDIFHKSEVLYNYHHAALEAKKLDEIYVFEGFMDVIAAEKAGISNSVATMGTAFTKNHIKSLTSLTSNIVLCFDGDEAGISATKKAAEMFSDSKVLPFAVALPEGLDPDEYLKKYGKDALKDYLNNKKVNIYDYLYNIAKNNLVTEDIESVERFKKNIFEILRKNKSTTLSEFYLKKMSVELDCDVNSLITDFGKMLPSKKDFSKEEKLKVVKNKKTLKPKIYKALEVIIKSSLISKEVLKEYYRLTENRYISDAMPYCTIIDQIRFEYDSVGVAEVDTIKEKLKNYQDAYECFEGIINNKLIDDKNYDVSMDCISTIIDYWEKEKRKEFFEQALKDDDKCGDLIQVVRKQHKLK